MPTPSLVAQSISQSVLKITRDLSRETREITLRKTSRSSQSDIFMEVDSIASRACRSQKANIVTFGFLSNKLKTSKTWRKLSLPMTFHRKRERRCHSSSIAMLKSPSMDMVESSIILPRAKILLQRSAASPVYKRVSSEMVSSTDMAEDSLEKPTLLRSDSSRREKLMESIKSSQWPTANVS